jgi:hypothetical protein
MPQPGSPVASPAVAIRETAAKLIVSEVCSVYAGGYQSQAATTSLNLPQPWKLSD